MSYLEAFTWRGEVPRIISVWNMGTMASDDTKRYSVDELEDKVAQGDYVPTRKDAPEIELDEDFWRNAPVVMPPGKKSVHLRVDADVLAWFRA